MKANPHLGRHGWVGKMSATVIHLLERTWPSPAYCGIFVTIETLYP